MLALCVTKSHQNWDVIGVIGKRPTQLNVFDFRAVTHEIIRVWMQTFAVECGHVFFRNFRANVNIFVVKTG